MKDKKRKYFDSTAEEFYRDYSGGNSLSTEIIRRYLEVILPLAENKRILEIGCGAGAILSRVEKPQNFTAGIDFSEKMLNLAKNSRLKSKLLSADARCLPFKDGVFDVAYSIRTLQHVPDYGSAILEMNRVLSEKGIVIFDVMNIINPFGFVRSVLFRPFEPVYLRAVSRSGIHKVCEGAGIDVLDIYPIQLLVDSSNLNKYLPKPIAWFTIRIFKFLDFIPRKKSFLARFALRLCVVGKKKGAAR